MPLVNAADGENDSILVSMPWKDQQMCINAI
jgi:hypothetical protein